MSEFTIDPQVIVDFWREAGPERWFSKDDELDRTITTRFGDIYERALAGELDDWGSDPTGALALVILLDQFPRNMFRGSPRAYEGDAKALQIAREALERGDQETVAEDINQFLAMPFMHSETIEDQEAALSWMHRIGDEGNVAAAQEHLEIISRFGRFPHRNPILGRASTPEEQAFLEGGGFAG